MKTPFYLHQKLISALKKTLQEEMIRRGTEEQPEKEELDFFGAGV